VGVTKHRRFITSFQKLESFKETFLVWRAQSIPGLLIGGLHKPRMFITGFLNYNVSKKPSWFGAPKVFPDC